MQCTQALLQGNRCVLKHTCRGPLKTLGPAGVLAEAPASTCVQGTQTPQLCTWTPHHAWVGLCCVPSMHIQGLVNRLSKDRSHQVDNSSLVMLIPRDRHMRPRPVAPLPRTSTHRAHARNCPGISASSSTARASPLFRKFLNSTNCGRDRGRRKRVMQFSGRKAYATWC